MRRPAPSANARGSARSTRIPRIDATIAIAMPGASQIYLNISRPRSQILSLLRRRETPGDEDEAKREGKGVNVYYSEGSIGFWH